MALVKSSDEKVDTKTGLISQGQLGQPIMNERRRKDGSVEVSYDYSNCPTMTEQHAAHLNDINYLIKKYRPDELAAYLAAKKQNRPEIIGHDFADEPDLQGAKNITYQVRKMFDELPDDVRRHFRNHVDYIKFIDNPLNQEKMIKMGLLTKKEIKDQLAPIQGVEKGDVPPSTTKTGETKTT